MLGAQRGLPTFRPKYIPYSYMDPLGLTYKTLVWAEDVGPAVASRRGPRKQVVQNSLSLTPCPSHGWLSTLWSYNTFPNDYGSTGDP